MAGHDPEDERAGGPPPDPSDRAWVHPTEMASASSQNHLSASPSLILVRLYQGDHGVW